MLKLLTSADTCPAAVQQPQQCSVAFFLSSQCSWLVFSYSARCLCTRSLFLNKSWATYLPLVVLQAEDGGPPRPRPGAAGHRLRGPHGPGRGQLPPGPALSSSRNNLIRSRFGFWSSIMHYAVTINHHCNKCKSLSRIPSWNLISTLLTPWQTGCTDPHFIYNMPRH